MAQPSPNDSAFKVIIAGGGVIGLVLANALAQADIDYLVVEKGDVAPSLGASIAVYPHTAKVLEQLGLWAPLRDVTLPVLERRHCVDDKNSPGGGAYAYAASRMPETLGRAAGGDRYIHFMDRKVFLDAMYARLDKAKVREHVRLASYTETETGVEVQVVNEGGRDEMIQGSILVGADGVHSRVRQIMKEGIRKEEEEGKGGGQGGVSRADAMDRAFTCDYRAYFGASRNWRPRKKQGGEEDKEEGEETEGEEKKNGEQLLDDSVATCKYGTGHSIGCVAGAPGTIFWFLFEKQLPPQQEQEQQQQQSSTTTRISPRVTEADKEAMVKRHLDTPAGPGFTFGDLWATRLRTNMVPMEEGILPGPWHSSKGRVVMMGDSVHKYTVNAGLGANQGIEGVCHLVNGLRRLLFSSSEKEGKESSITTATATAKQLSTVFASYESRVRERAGTTMTMSYWATRMEAQETWWLRLARVVTTRWVPDGMQAGVFLDYFAGAPVLDFLPPPVST